LILSSSSNGFLTDRSEVSLGRWIKAARDEMGLSQRKFALLLRKHEVKVSGSDIGNLEIEFRPTNYRPKRLEKIKSAVLKVLEEWQALKN
jgi:transcriptional regulator with XRE-family HTH domain